MGTSGSQSTPLTGRISYIWPDQWKESPHRLLRNLNQEHEKVELEEIRFDFHEKINTVAAHNHDTHVYSAQSPMSYAGGVIEAERSITKEIPRSSDTSISLLGSSSQIVDETSSAKNSCSEEGTAEEMQSTDTPAQPSPISLQSKKPGETDTLMISGEKGDLQHGLELHPALSSIPPAADSPLIAVLNPGTPTSQRPTFPAVDGVAIGNNDDLKSVREGRCM
jgi:hypothetical protein